MKVSVIIPMYNSRNNIRNCLESVLNQDFKDIEIICVDDGSSDDTKSIVNMMMKNDDRIKLICCDHHNSGYCRNRGLEIAEGDYCHFLDSDDWVDSNIYTELFGNMLNNEDVVIFTRHRYDSTTGKTIEIPLNHPTGYKTRFLCEPDQFLTSMVAAWNKLFRRDFIVSNNIHFDEIPCANDRYFYFHSIVCAKSILFVNKPLMTYRWKNSESIVGSIRTNDFTSPIFTYYNIKNTVKNTSNMILDVLYTITADDILSFVTAHTHENNVGIIYEWMVKEEENGRHIIDKYIKEESKEKYDIIMSNQSINL